MSVVAETLLFEREIKKAALVLRAVNHPLRKKVLFLLEQRNALSVTDIYASLRIDQSVASAQLGILRDAGVVGRERRGKHLVYFINRHRLKTINQLSAELAGTKIAQ